MHNGNWFAVSRMVFDHYVVGAGNAVAPDDPGRGAYSKMEAWLDLVAMAAYEKTKVMNKGREQIVEPGQLMGAHGYLAIRWNWTVKTVRVFLKQLEICEMITRYVHEFREGKQKNSNFDAPQSIHQINGKREGNQKGNQCQVIGICNYSRYQLPDDYQGQAIGQAIGQAEGKQGASEGQAKGQESNTREQNNNKQKEEEALDLSDSVADATSLPPVAHSKAQQAFEDYNDLALKVGLPQARSLAPDRKKLILKRMREHGDDSWNLLLANISRSAFLQGKNNKEWRPTGLDWFLKPANYTKVIEGAYGNGAHADGEGESQEEKIRRIIEEDERQGVAR